MKRPSADQLKEFARAYPYIMFGILLIPVTYSITGDPGMSVFTGGIVAFGKQIADGIQDAKNDDEPGAWNEEPVEAQFDE